MKVPLNWIKEYTPIKLSNQELFAKIRSQIGEIEEEIEYTSTYKGTILAEVLSREDHPDADKLAIYKLNIGEREAVQVVAGDRNLKKGDKVAYFKPGTQVPFNAFPEKFDGIVKPVKLRGIESNGMMASGKELDITNDHTKVLRLNTDHQPGTDISVVLEMTDTTVDIENKALTNRADLFSIIGLAKEISGIQQLQFEEPSIMTETFPSEFENQDKSKLPLEVSLGSKELCNRYIGVTLSNVVIEESPLWLQSKLVRSGLRPINNIVDITNYIMVLTGQPLHAFDYDKLVKKDPTKVRHAQIVVRTAQNGEKLTTLDGKVHKLDEKNLVICDSTNPIALAGIMGGLDTEIDEDTKNIVLESANFDMYNNRKSSMSLGVFTDAVTRFSKGQDPNLSEKAALEAVRMLTQLSEATVSNVIDIYPNRAELSKERKISFNKNRLNLIDSIDLESTDIKKILDNVLLKTDITDEMLTVTIPTNRSDLREDVDIFEEVVRLYGYEKVRVSLPSRDIKPADHNQATDLKKEIRKILSNNGANEVLTYNFVDLQMFEDHDLDAEVAYRLKNPLSPELEFMRTALLPSLFSRIRKNIEKNQEKLAIYELNVSHRKDALDSENLPYERESLSLLVSVNDDSAKETIQGSPYYTSKMFLDKLLLDIGVKDFYYESLNKIDKELLPSWITDMTSLFDQNAVAIVVHKTEIGDNPLGIIGEISPRSKISEKLPEYSSGFEIDTGILLSGIDNNSKYIEPSNFPSVINDLCFIVDADVPYQIMVDLLEDELSSNMNVNSTISPIDIYQSNSLLKRDLKYVTVRIELTHKNRTLKKKEVDNILKKASRSLRRATNAKLKE